MLSKVLSSGFLGIDSYKVEVEVDVANGLPIFSIVGLADIAISESKERVRAALKNCKFDMTPKRIVVNLSPAGIKKEGPQFDLPIALGIMKAMGHITEDKRLEDYMYIGELSLGGKVRRTRGIINAVICAREKGMEGIVIPAENYSEASTIEGIDIIAVKDIREVYDFVEKGIRTDVPPREEMSSHIFRVDFKEVKGQQRAKRALEISAGGGHNVYMVGSPGSGKSMMSKRLPTIMPSMNQEEIIDTTKIYSSAGMLGDGMPIVTERPFRSPHHSTSGIALVGGGRVPKAGEISLAHNGVLFLDEAPEFPRSILETLRQPMEDGRVSITRSDYRVEFPSEFILLLSCNPCPCGMSFEGDGKCRCSAYEIERYNKKISGPILDRMDLYIEVRRLEKRELMTYGDGERSEDIKIRVQRARGMQKVRFGSGKLNSRMTQKEIREYCILDDEGRGLLEDAIERLRLSARSYDKILKVARTIADLEGVNYIERKHLLEALSFRKTS